MSNVNIYEEAASMTTSKLVCIRLSAVTISILLIAIDIIFYENLAMDYFLFLVIIFSLFEHKLRAPFIYAALLSALVLIGLLADIFLNLHQKLELQFLFINAAISVAILWLIAGVIFIRRRTAPDPRNMTLLISSIMKTHLVAEFSLEGIIQKANENYLNIMGYSIGEIVGCHHSILVDPAQKESKQYSQFWKLLRQGEFMAGTFKRLNKMGEHIWIHGAYVPVIDETGKPINIIKIAADITMGKAAILKQVNEFIDNKRLVVYYQPIIDARNGDIATCEALLRVVEQDGRIGAPAAFLDMAAQCGATSKLSLEIIRMIEQDFISNSIVLPVTINLSVSDLCDNNLIDRLLGAHGVRFNVEVTETVFMDEPETIINRLQQLRDGNMRIYLDDFGTGYSSLVHLAEMPVDVIKIDRSFIQKAQRSSKDTIVCRTLVGMANELGLGCVGEGVEIIVERDFLINIGCFLQQGYLAHRPMPVASLADLVSKNANR